MKQADTIYNGGDMDLLKLANAVACAIAVLEGTSGGYSPEAKMQAKLTLMQWQPLITKTVTDTLASSQR